MIGFFRVIKPWKERERMFADNFYFMTREELVSYNRCMGTPGCKVPSREDEDRFFALQERVKDISILRTESGAIPYIP